jgi:hypothetical protein
MEPKKWCILVNFFLKIVCVTPLSGTTAPSTTFSSKVMSLSVTAQEMKQEGTEHKSG